MKRYLIDFDTDNLKKSYSDVLIIGSGIAGVYTALELGDQYSIEIVTKEEVEISNSVLAQGGIAVSLDKNDSPEEHMKDTLYAGAGLCDPETVSVLVHEAADNIGRVCNFGVQFDKKDANSPDLALTREAAHSKNRIIHAGDATGKEVCDKLIHSVMQRKNVHISERIWALDLLVEEGKCCGIIAYDDKAGEYRAFYAGLVICASGGYGQLYSHTTNPEVATGDGAACAFRAGASLTDMEFIQFHPTVLYHKENNSFLISEAVRGEGAILRNSKGERFMEKYHELKELAPRDVVARSIFREMKLQGEDHMYLDITHKDRDYLEHRFPTIFSKCLSYGIDLSKDYIPIAPAEHYCMGGIKTGLYGDTSIEGFYACGESACNGIHGANRLASNSLLEGLVFGRRIGISADEILSKRTEIPYMPRFFSDEYKDCESGKMDSKSKIAELKKIMTTMVGIVRSKEELEKALSLVEEMQKERENVKNIDLNDFILTNGLIIASAIIKSAIRREESRGAHFRSDYPQVDDTNWKKHVIVNKDGVKC